MPSPRVADVKQDPQGWSLLASQRASNPTVLPHTSDGTSVLLCYIFVDFLMTAVELFCCVFATSGDAHCCCDSGAFFFFFHFGTNRPSFRLFFLLSVSCVNASRLSLSERGFSHRLPQRAAVRPALCDCSERAHTYTHTWTNTSSNEKFNVVFRWNFPFTVRSSSDVARTTLPTRRPLSSEHRTVTSRGCSFTSFCTRHLFLSLYLRRERGTKGKDTLL